MQVHPEIKCKSNPLLYFNLSNITPSSVSQKKTDKYSGTVLPRKPEYSDQVFV